MHKTYLNQNLYTLGRIQPYTDESSRDGNQTYHVTPVPKIHLFTNEYTMHYMLCVIMFIDILLLLLLNVRIHRTKPNSNKHKSG